MNTPTPHFNGLTPAEQERLALLAEEAAEVIQIVGKILRHGYESYNPTIENPPTNRELLTRELGDMDAALKMMFMAGDIRRHEVIARSFAKADRVRLYLHHQGQF